MLDWLSSALRYLLSNAAQEVYDSGSTSLYRAHAQLEGMRARDLRKVLMKLGADPAEVSKILNKVELRDLAAKLIHEEIGEKATAAWTERAFKYTLIALGVGLILISRKPLLALIKGVVDYLRGVRYLIKSKLGLVRLSFRHRLPFVCLALVFTALLELVSPLMQASIVASWLLPSQSPLRRYLFPSLSIPVTANMIMGTLSGTASQSPRRKTSSSSSTSTPLAGSVAAALGDMGSYGLNVGPMITLMVVGFVKNRVENWAASFLIDIVEERRRRKESKRQRESDKAWRERGGHHDDTVAQDWWGEASTASVPRANAPAQQNAPPPAPPSGMSMEEILRHGNDNIISEGSAGSGWDELD
jgi:hypothetical protein